MWNEWSLPWSKIPLNQKKNKFRRVQRRFFFLFRTYMCNIVMRASQWTPVWMLDVAAVVPYIHHVFCLMLFFYHAFRSCFVERVISSFFGEPHKTQWQHQRLKLKRILTDSYAYGRAFGTHVFKLLLSFCRRFFFFIIFLF